MIFSNKKKQLQREIISISQEMNKKGINQGSSGNISVRYEDGMLITPSSISYEELTINNIVYMDFNGSIKNLSNRSHQNEPNRPSSEWNLHAEILKTKSEVNAVMHCHSIYATAIACHQKGIPSFHYMTAICGGEDIRCGKYATFGTENLALNAIEALEKRSACLLANHGQLTIGDSLEEAFLLSIEVETLAKIYIKSFQLGNPFILSPIEMNNVLKKFREIKYK